MTSGNDVFQQFGSTPSATEGVDSFDSSTKGRYRWQKQKTHKGRALIADPPGTSWLGWGFSINGHYANGYPPQYAWDGFRGIRDLVYTPQQAASASAAQLREDPVFRHNPEPTMFNATIPQADLNAMLARGVPALSPPIGGNAISITDSAGTPISGRNFDMNQIGNSSYRPNGWPRNHSEFKMRWLHSDVKDIAYFYAHPVIEEIVGKGDMK